MSLVRQWRARCTIWQRIEGAGIGQGEVLLTFDDGPCPEVTPRLLDVLERENVRAAFCVCGKSVRAAPALVRRMAEQNHLLVNHGYLHQPLALFSARALYEEITRCDQAITAALETPGFSVKFFRPACGLWTPVVTKVVTQLGKQVLPITYFGWDTSVTRHTYLGWVASTRQAARDDKGGIFVLHDRRLRFWGEPHYDPKDSESSAYRGWVPEAAALLIEQLRSDGFALLDPNVWSQRWRA
jgi:peptidoglycan/xylan/chitin deacetylase (PgdA/CDA1 family)